MFNPNPNPPPAEYAHALCAMFKEEGGFMIKESFGHHEGFIWALFPVASLRTALSEHQPPKVLLFCLTCEKNVSLAFHR